MADHEARGRAVYDHTNDDDPRPFGRRRPAADWGVGEEIFDRLPSRRGDHPHGGAGDGRRTIVIGGSAPEPAPDEHTEEFATREEALRERANHDSVWGGDEPFASGGDPRPAPREVTFARGDQPGRRTVKIGGRPGEHLPLDRPQRRRPPRTVGERLGTRPDRVAAWAFALGVLLILIAVATAQAAVA